MCILEKREPLPHQDDRSTNVIEHVDARDGLQRDSDGPCRQCPSAPDGKQLKSVRPFCEPSNGIHPWSQIKLYRPHASCTGPEFFGFSKISGLPRNYGADRLYER
jgi:hypothetical protein